MKARGSRANRLESPDMKIPLRLLALAAAAILSGCAALEGQDLAAEPTSDEGIAALANSRLNDDAMVGRCTLSASVESGLATLYGTVPDEATRQRAIRILENTPGIFDVVDQTRKR